MKRGITVTYMFDQRGWGFKRIAKAKGKLTIDEIRQALIDDAMNYIFRAGEGYRPFRRDKKYEG